jgi:hypothetical protein
LESTQEELMKMQIRYQKEIEKLEKQNKELKTQLLLKSGTQTLTSAKLRKIKVIRFSFQILRNMLFLRCKSGLLLFRCEESSLQDM